MAIELTAPTLIKVAMSVRIAYDHHSAHSITIDGPLMPRYTFKSSLLSKEVTSLGIGLIGCAVIFHVHIITNKQYEAYATTVTTAIPIIPN